MTDGYVTTAPLASRIAIHQYGTNPVSWYDFVRALLPSGGAVLDAGAGTGILWPPGTRGVTAVDRSAAMCAVLRERGLPVARASVDALPFGDGTFDGVVCNHVLYHLASPREGLAELRRVVRAGGWVAVATNGTGHMAEVNDAAVAAGLPAADVHEHFPAEGVAAALGEFFGEVAVHRYDDTLLVPDAAPVMAYVASCAGRPLTRAEEAAVAAYVGDAPFRVSKHTVLALAR